jgi:hypothetical protein
VLVEIETVAYLGRSWSPIWVISGNSHRELSVLSSDAEQLPLGHPSMIEIVSRHSK